MLHRPVCVLTFLALYGVLQPAATAAADEPLLRLDFGPGPVEPGFTQVDPPAMTTLTFGALSVTLDSQDHVFDRRDRGDNGLPDQDIIRDFLIDVGDGTITVTIAGLDPAASYHFKLWSCDVPNQGFLADWSTNRTLVAHNFTSTAPMVFSAAADSAGKIVLFGQGLDAAGDVRLNGLEMSGPIALPPDADGDGVLNGDDRCPGTARNSVVNAEGCSVDDFAPCTRAWKNHGAYVSSITHAAHAFAAVGLLTSEQAAAIVARAARSSCGGR